MLLSVVVHWLLALTFIHSEITCNVQLFRIFAMNLLRFQCIWSITNISSFTVPRQHVFCCQDSLLPAGYPAAEH